MTPNILLALMLTSYAVPIVFVYFKYAPPPPLTSTTFSASYALRANHIYARHGHRCSARCSDFRRLLLIDSLSYFL